MFKITQPVALYKGAQPIACCNTLMELCQITNSDITVLFAVIESGQEIYLSSAAQIFGKVKIKQVTLNAAKEVAQYKRTRIKHRLIGFAALMTMLLTVGIVGVHQAHHVQDAHQNSVSKCCARNPTPF